MEVWGEFKYIICNLAEEIVLFDIFLKFEILLYMKNYEYTQYYRKKQLKTAGTLCYLSIDILFFNSLDAGKNSVLFGPSSSILSQ